MENCDGIARRENKNGLFSMKKSVVILYYKHCAKMFRNIQFSKKSINKAI